MADQTPNWAIAHAETRVQKGLSSAGSQVFNGFLYELVLAGIWMVPIAIAVNAAAATIGPKWIGYQSQQLSEPLLLLAYYGKLVGSPLSTSQEFLGWIRGQVIEGARDAIVSNSPLGIAWRAISGINFSFGEKSFTPNENQSEVIGTVIRVGHELGANEAQVVTAIATCIVESKCRELDGGDRDSIGAFQQRPSQDWPDTANTETQARAFFQGSGTNPGLFDVWHQTDNHTRMGALAQEVQKSAYPERYAEWMGIAQEIYDSAIVGSSRTFPIPGETLDSVTITSGFGVRTVFGQSDEHNGVDIAAAAGTVIVSTSNGNVEQVEAIVDQKQVCISSEIGVECFIHLDNVVVAEGDRVVAGQKIGVIAATSVAARQAKLSTGDHLDYRVSIDGEWVDPIPYLEDLQ